jgi:copper chaperone CopZ
MASRLAAGEKPYTPIGYSGDVETRVYAVPEMHCDHCRAAVQQEVGAVPGVESVAVDLETKRVEVSGRSLDDAAIREAITEAGYEAV